MINSVAVSDPGAAGVKLTLIEQLAFAVRLDPQVLFCEKSFELVVMLLMLNVAPPTLVKLTPSIPLVVFTHWFPKESVDGEVTTAGAGGFTTWVKVDVTEAKFWSPE